MGNSRRLFLLTFVVQLFIMTNAQCNHGNQTWDLLDVGFKMLEMMNNIFELTNNVNKLQSTNQALRSDVQQLQNTNQALHSDLQQLQNTTKEIIDNKIQGSQG